MRTSENQRRLGQRYARLKSYQKCVFASVMISLYSRMNEDTTHTYGKALILQEGSGVCKKFTLNLLRDIEMSQ